VKLTGIQRFQETTLGTSSPTSRNISATCPGTKRAVGGPAGKKLLGTGGIVGGPAGRVSFQQVRPNQQGAFAFVQGVREINITDPFTVTAIAICANPVQGWHVVIDGTDVNTGRVQTATATCGANEQIVGTGLTKGDVYGFAHVDALVPQTLNRSLFSSGGIPDPTPTYRWNLASWAVCVTR
jgi:hypothetical protein